MRLTSKLLVVTLVVVVALGGGFMLGRAQAGTAAAPGTPGDPLVSKSYVDQVVAGLAARTDLETNTQFRVVTVPAGQRLVGSAGTEIVLRGGQAKVIASKLGGLLDVTAGRDVAEGEQVVPNHLMVVPRTDGRGVIAMTEVIAMVRGNATIGQ